MKRTGFKPREKGLDRAGGGLERARLRPISVRRQKVNKERQAALRAAWGDPAGWRCWFAELPPRFRLRPVVDGVVGLVKDSTKIPAGKCHGLVHGHETLKRSRAGRSDANLLNVDGMVPLCNFHNGWVENFPVEANLLGLAWHGDERGDR